METGGYVFVRLLVWMFKSYYVVWKLHMTPQQKAAWHEFKSYYVVWKLIGMSYLRRSIVGLNRTM